MKTFQLAPPTRAPLYRGAGWPFFLDTGPSKGWGGGEALCRDVLGSGAGGKPIILHHGIGNHPSVRTERQSGLKNTTFRRKNQ